MKTRAITGFFFIIVMLASVLLGHWVFGGFFLILSLLCLNEFYSLIKQTGTSPNLTTGIFAGAIIYTVFAFYTADTYNLLYQKLIFLIVIAITAVFAQELFKKAPAPFTNLAYTFLGLILTIVPFTFFSCVSIYSIGF